MARYATSFTTAVAASPAAGAETVIATIGPLSPPTDLSPILLIWQFTVLMGTNGIGYNVRVRQGTTTAGTALYTPTQGATLAAAAAGVVGGMFIDSAPGADQQYALCLVCNSASAPSTVTALCFMALAL